MFSYLGSRLHRAVSIGAFRLRYNSGEYDLQGVPDAPDTRRDWSPHAGRMTTPTRTSPSNDPSTLSQRAVRGGLWVVASSYWMVLIGFLANIALTRIINDAVAFGTFAGAMFFVELLRLQNKLGLNYAYINYRPDPHDPAADSIARATYIGLELAAIAGGLLLASSGLVLLHWFGYGTWVAGGDQVLLVALILSLAAALDGFANVWRVLLEKELLFTGVSIVNMLVAPLAYAVGIVLALRGVGVGSLIGFVYVQYVLQLAGVLWLAWRAGLLAGRVRWQLDRPLAAHFLRYGGIVGLGMLATMLLTQLDNFYILTFVGVSVLGFYDRAYRTAQWPSTLLAALTARIALYTYAHLQDDMIRLQKSVAMVIWLIVMLAMPLALAIFLAAPDIIVLLYGPDWLPAAIFLRILVLFAVIRPLWENASNLFVAIGKPRLPLIFMTVQVAVLAIAGLPLTLWFGALGTTGAVGLAFAIGMLLIYRDILREVQINMVRELAVPFLVTLLTLGGYLLLTRIPALAELAVWWRVGWKLGYTFVAFYVLLFALQPHAMRERIRLIWAAARRTPSTATD